ncbi:hypothetical protein IWQ54_001110 [Labrenzia sp. EL_195]|nr:hypothetical protein [Labrenzia sp. EL_195]
MPEGLMLFVLIAAAIWLVGNLIRYFVFPPGDQQAAFASRSNTPSSRLAHRVSAQPPPAAPRPPIVDPGERVEEPALTAPDTPAEAATFMIEYTDANGIFSRRRITVASFKKASDGTPMLYARCHERNAMRSFRVDQISCCIDYDGEVHDNVMSFLAESVGLDPQPQHDNWERVRTLVRPHAVVLTAIAITDGDIPPEELEKIVSHCMKVCDRQKIQATPHEVSLRRYIKRLRPTEKDIEDACSKLRSASQTTRQELFDTAEDFLFSEGTEDEEEDARYVDLCGLLEIDRWKNAS